MKEGEPLIKGKEALADAYADSRSDYPLDRWEALHDGYLQGYKDAEQDLALTWEDMRTINDLFLKVDSENSAAWDYEVIEQDLPYPYGQKFYEEVLRRFRETKNK